MTKIKVKDIWLLLKHLMMLISTILNVRRCLKSIKKY
jgi:hypothetical protein